MSRGAFLAAALLPLASVAAPLLGPRQNPDDQFRFFWYLSENCYERARDAGVNTIINAYGGHWSENNEKNRKVQQDSHWRFAARMEKDGIGYIHQVKLQQCGPFIKRYPQRKRDGSPNNRSMDLSNPDCHAEVLKRLQWYADSLKGCPALVGVQTCSEIQDGSYPSFTPSFAAKCRAELGFDHPPEFTGHATPHWSRLKDFPVSRVVPAGYAPLRFYRWFWTKGDGWGDYQDTCAAIFHKTISPDLITMYDPIARTPPIRGTGGHVMYGSQWYYETPEPYGIAYEVSTQMAKARGTPGQRVWTMIQGIMDRRMSAPIGRTVANTPKWVGERPNGTWITMPPDIIREALWMLFSRKIDGIGLYAHNVFFDCGNPLGSGYQFTNPHTFEAIEDAFRRAGVPLGPLIKAIPERAPEVAFLESGTSCLLGAGGGSWGRSYVWGDMATAANLQPYVMFEEDLAESGVPPTAKVLILPEASVLTEKAFAAVVAFQERGGTVVADDAVVPGILADVTLPGGMLSRYDRQFDCREDGIRIRRGAKELRAGLQAACGYTPYADSDNGEIIVHARTYRDADYVFAVNDRREYGDYVGQWKMINEKGLPNSGEVTVKRAAGAVYDLVNHRAVPFTVRDGRTVIPARYETTDGRIFLVASKPLAKLEVAVKGNEVIVTTRDKNVMIPIEVTSPALKRPFYGVVQDGAWRHAFPSEGGTLLSVQVRNLADGRCASASAGKAACPFRAFGTAYYPEDRAPEQWDADLAAMAELGLNAVRIGEFNWSGFEPREGEFDFAPYRRFLDLCAARGMRVMMCTPTAAMPRWLAKRYPDVLKVRADGTRPANGLRLDYCASSARYRALARRIVAREAEAFRDHPAVVAWQIDNEIHPRAGTGLCVCPACEEGLRAALRKRYGTVENLNRAWHGSFWSGLFNDWDEITLPLGERTGWKREYVRYESDAFLSFAFEQRDILRRINPKWTLTQNSWGCSGEFRLDELFRGLDTVSADNYLCREDRLDYRRWQMAAFRGLSGRQKPFTVGETGPFFVNTCLSNSYEAVKCWNWELAARGAESLYYFCWNTSVSGEEMSVRILPWSERKGRAYRAVREFARDVSSLPTPLGLEPLAPTPVAIVHDAEAAQYHYVEGGPFAEYFWNVHKRLHDACERFGVSPDVVQLSDGMDLSPYRIVFLPPCERWSAPAVARLKDFVRRGGTVVAVTHQNYLTEGGAYVKEPWPVGMTDLYGLEVIEQRRLRRPDAKPATVPLAFAGGPFAAEWYVESVVPQAAEVLERLSSTCFAGDPLLTRNAFGKGRAWYLACGADAEGCQSLVRRVFRASGLATDRVWPRPAARLVRGAYVVLTNFSSEPAEVPGEAGELLFGAPEILAAGRLRLAPFGVAVFASRGPLGV